MASHSTEQLRMHRFNQPALDADSLMMADPSLLPKLPRASYYSNKRPFPPQSDDSFDDDSEEEERGGSVDFRRLALESKDTREELAFKAGGGGGEGEKARSILVTQWLLENYEASAGTSIPRSALYDHYSAYCSEQNLEAVNSASFGKLIRSVFPELKTRRLGTRGKSKYHYCGIAPKAPKEGSPIPARAELATHSRTSSSLKFLPSVEDSVALSPSITPEPKAPANLPELPQFLREHVPMTMSFEACKSFLSRYADHCQTVLTTVQYMKFGEVESNITSYWTHLSLEDRDVASTPEIVEYIWRYDSILYDTIMNLLLPNVLQVMPINIIQSVRHFAKQLDAWISAPLSTYPPLLVSKKLEVAKVFIQQLRRHTSLNHLAQAASTVLESSKQVEQMVSDWARIDFENIREQSSWVCECRREDILQIMEVDFKALLEAGSKLEHWTNWLETIVNRFLDDKTLEPERYVYGARQFLLKWAFYSSLAMRDLTLRSASSFGSFHLLRLLFDEYIFYLVEARVTQLV